MNVQAAIDECPMIDSRGSALVRLSTADLPDQDRLAIWREHYGRMVLWVDFEPAGGTSFDASLIARALPGLCIVSEAKSAVRASRTRELIADGNEDFVVVVNRAGAMIAFARGREVALGEGDAVLMSGSDVAALDRYSFGGSLSLRIPHSILSSLVVDIDDAVMHLIPRHTAALELMTSYASALLSDGTVVTPELRGAIVAHLHDLVALTLGASRALSDVARRRGVARRPTRVTGLSARGEGYH
jgi:hypothetical protein